MGKTTHTALPYIRLQRRLMDNYRWFAGGAPPQWARVRSVWRHNADQEFALIRQVVPWYRTVAMDTEFPGVVYSSKGHPCEMTPEQHYAQIKANVDALNVVQVGLTLSNANGRLPEMLGEVGVGYVWQFNIRGFHPARDPHVEESVKLLREQGMDFDALERDGIEPQRFKELMLSSGLLMNCSTLGWVTFHSHYDFAYLVKILTGGPLPGSLEGFMNALRYYFGNWVLDVKYVLRHCRGFCGGLDVVANDLNVVREVGRSHQAGSDSLLTFRIFRRILEIYFPRCGIEQYVGFIYGLAPY